jgi:hypothetical protein
LIPFAILKAKDLFVLAITIATPDAFKGYLSKCRPLHCRITIDEILKTVDIA